MNMNINVSVTRLLILTCPLFVYGQVSIVPSGSATENSLYKLSCTVTSFIGTATWAKDASTLTTCTSSMCSVVSSGIYTFSSDASGIQVVMNPVSSSVDGLWKCTSSSGHFQELNVTSTSSPPSEMSTYLTTERTTSVNSIFEFSNITIPMITGSITPTSDISASTTSFLNTGTTKTNAHTEATNFYSNTETTYFYTQTETTTSYANTETPNFNANTETNEIQTKTLRIVSNYMVTYQSMFVTTAANDISGSFETTSQIMTETFELPGYSLSSYNDLILLRTFETSNVFHQTFSKTSISLSVDTLSNNLFNTLDVRLGSLITTNCSKYSICSMTISQSYIGDSFIASLSTLFYVPILTSDTTGSDFEIINESRVNTFSLKTEAVQTLITTAAVDSSAINTTEFYETLQTEFTSYVTKSYTDNAATGIYSKEIVTSGNFWTSYMHTGVVPSQTQLASMNDIQDSTTDFQSTYFEPYSQSNDEGFSSEISENVLTTLQSTSFLLQFNIQASASEVDSNMETTNMLTFKSQSGIPTKDLSLFTNPSSIQIYTVLIDFKPTLLTTTIDFNSKTMPSMIKPSSKKTNSGISYIEIETSFKDSLFSLDSFSSSVTSNDQDMTSVSSGVYKSIRTLSTNTIQSGLSEKNKTIIFITITSAVITVIVVILLIILAKDYMSKKIMKPRKENDNISWSNKSIPPKAAFPDYSFTGKGIYPLLNTSSVSFKMFPYEHHLNDIV